MLIKKILFPIEFTDRCRIAGGYVVDLATAHDAQVILLHVIPPIDREVGLPDFSSPALATLVERRKQDRTKKIETFMAEEFTGIRVQRRLEEGIPAERIIETCRDCECGLIVMPTHGYGPFRRFLLGSVTGKVLHDAECPVWTAAHLEDLGSHRTGPITKVLCAIDLGPRSEPTLRWAWEFAKFRNAELSIVHAIAPQPVSSSVLEVGKEEPRDDMTPIRERIEELRQKVGAEAEIMLYVGDPHKVVREATEDAQADLVVIGRATTAGVIGRMRENVYAIVRESPCPVVSI